MIYLGYLVKLTGNMIMFQEYPKDATKKVTAQFDHEVTNDSAATDLSLMPSTHGKM